jgi:hypothetical protein
MDITTLLAGPAGAALGLLGSLAQKWLGMKEKAADHKMKMEHLEVMSRVDLQKADIMFRATVEEKQGESLKAAIDAQAALRPSAPWANDFLSLFRPGLTLVLMISSTALAIWYNDTKPELAEFVITSLFTMSSVSVGFWFGSRENSKMAITQAFPTSK